MKRLLYFFVTVVVVAVVFSSCSAFSDIHEKTYSSSDLVGTWQNNANPQHYMVFTYDTSDSITEGYRYGYEWDESEDVYKEDLVEHGNGWF